MELEKSNLNQADILQSLAGVRGMDEIESNTLMERQRLALTIMFLMVTRAANPL